jgi:aldehyde:ferredoxin oxidoreductase
MAECGPLCFTSTRGGIIVRNIVRVNTRTGDIRTAPGSEEELRWGGRSLIAHLMLREVRATCDPLGRENKLIVASGWLGDTAVTTAGRCSVGGKSPLTGGVKEANVGGEPGKDLARLGLRALVLEDAPDRPETRVVFVGKDRCEILSAPELRGAEVGTTFELLRQRFGEHVSFFCIGPAGEMCLGSAAVATTDKTGTQARFAARGGLGAVMGSKRIKAIVFDDSGARPEAAHDPDGLTTAARELWQILRDDPKTANRHDFGTPAVLAICDSLGVLPTRNFQTGHFEEFEAISGERIADLIVGRGGEGDRGLLCVRGCNIQCSNVFPDPQGKTLVASLQYENLGLLGSNCGIGDVDEVARINHLCNQVGVDTIEAGAAIGVAMEAGIIRFGDSTGAKDLVKQIGKGTPLGRILGSGVVVTGRALGVRRVPAVKGQAIPAYDPRSLKGIGVTYATSPQGADHTAGNALEMAKTLDQKKPDGQVAASLRLQVRGALLDSLGVCLFIRPAFVKNPDLIPRLLNARFGWSLTFADVRKMGLECLAMERDFNRLAGVSDELCDVPEFMRTEPLSPYNTVFDVPREEMKRIWEVQLPVGVF